MDPIVAAALEIFQSGGVNTKRSVSHQTKYAIQKTKIWQKMIKEKNGSINTEVSVNGIGAEKIDAVDKEKGVAYEWKVSGKNVSHEFYKDVCKIITYNLHHPKQKLKKLIFITEEKGAEKFKRRFDEMLKNFFKKKLDVEIEIVGLKR